MSLTLAIVGSVVVAVVISVIAALRGTSNSDNTSQEDWEYAGRSLSIPSVVALLLSSSFSLNGLVYQIWLGHELGWYGLLPQVAWCMSFVFLIRFSKIIKGFAAEGGLHGAIGKYFGPRAQRLAAVATVVGFTLMIGWEVSVAVRMLEFISPLSIGSALTFAVGMSLLAATYSALGGLRANASANRVQAMFAILAVCLCCRRPKPA